MVFGQMKKKFSHVIRLLCRHVYFKHFSARHKLTAATFFLLLHSNNENFRCAFLWFCFFFSHFPLSVHKRN